MSSNRTVAIVIVALLHVLLGYALVTGLAYNVIKKAADDLKTFDVEEEPPPPPEEPPPPPPDEPQPQTEPPPVAPPPLVRTTSPPIQIQSVPVAPPRVINPIPAPQVLRPPPPPPPPPPPVQRSEPKSAVGSLQGLIRTDDYPQSAIENEEQGTAVVSLQISPSGRVAGCSVSKSSGSRTLDSTTCRILSSRAKFTPAIDSNGNPTSGTTTGRITWRLE